MPAPTPPVPPSCPHGGGQSDTAGLLMLATHWPSMAQVLRAIGQRVIRVATDA